jgi:hypothetical protein
VPDQVILDVGRWFILARSLMDFLFCFERKPKKKE